MALFYKYIYGMILNVKEVTMKKILALLLVVLLVQTSMVAFAGDYDFPFGVAPTVELPDTTTDELIIDSNAGTPEVVEVIPVDAVLYDPYVIPFSTEGDYDFPFG